MIKRIFDFSLALTSLVFLSPIFLILALIIKIETPGPVFFRQARMGKKFVPFQIYKFRSMVVDNSERPFQLVTTNDSRITTIGKVLRKSKLDEIPQLINILKGEMSFVGPRPELKMFTDKYHQEFEEILKIKPGLTDLASVEFKDEESLHSSSENLIETYIEHIMPKKIELAKIYSKNPSFLFDLQIILKTLFKLIFR